MSITAEVRPPPAAGAPPPDLRPAMRPLFRPEALQHMQGPARSDDAVRVVTAPGWIALAAAFAVAAGACAWGVLGHVSSYVHAQGLLGPTANAGNLTGVVATEGGILRTIEVSLGARVRQGDMIATVEIRDAAQAKASAQHTIAQVEAERARELAYWDGYLAQQFAGLSSQQRDLERQALASAETIRSRTQILDGELDLLPRGLTTRAKSAAARDRVVEEQANLARISTSLQQLAAKRLELDNQRRTTLYRYDQQLLEARERQLDAERRLAQGGRVMAPIDGTVVMKELPLNSVVQPGSRILVIQADSAVMEGVFFAEPRQGKRIAPGMPVNITPSTVEASRYGTVIGRVAWVSAVPQTAQAMLRQLGNDTLGHTFAGNDAPIAFGVVLELDRHTPSGLRWSSHGGPPYAIDANTLGDADVVVQRDAPATLVIPALRRFLGAER